ncbi:DUF4360 domain-containing protein [Amycolatopsis sp. EV170708-02-1]|uniref:DUF4360 domain-containing protein n=1 Tax=Amycolatopsis sp. EV170708-02-1 TaxID=2919322 RepID=UPI001F0C9F2A|nr:DUF4360 domain-containing protein [Amycolatopsis sp. EV170708-02-1]UMP06945.1 DUF4360 domain-containing protein [Amycolatopsis sp. EV170708-02-1]
MSCLAWNAPTTTCHGNSPTSYVNHNLKGLFEDNWEFTDDIEVGAIVYKPCGEDRNFNINTELRAAVGTSDPKKTTSFGLPTRTQASE